jgi:type I restriction enzyme, S subunit
MSGSKIYKLSTSSPIANLVMFFTERILGDEYSGKVGDYIQSIQTGKTPPMNVPKYYSSNYIGWAKPCDIGKGKYLVDLPDKLSKVAVEENKVTLYEPGTLLIICIGAGVGRVALTDEVISSNQQITGILFDTSVIPEYAYYYFFCREAVFKQNASQTTLPIINQKGLKDLDFRCPDRKLQKTFLVYLHYCEECLINEEFPLEEGYDLPHILFQTAKKFFVSYYAQNNILKELDQQQTYVQLLRQTILQEAVKGKLTKQDPTDEPATELLKRIKAEKEKLIKAGKLKKEKELPPITEDEISFELPEGWAWCRLQEVTTLITDGKHGDSPNQSNSGYYFLSAKDVKDGKLNYEYARQITYEGFLETHKRTDLKPGDICLVNTGATIGKIAIAEDNELTPRTTFQKSVAVIKILQEYVAVDYVEIFLRGSVSHLVKTSGGSAINNLLLGDLKHLLFPLPPLSEQQGIVAKVQQLQQQLSQLEAQVQQSRQYAQQLLQSVLKEAFEQKAKAPHCIDEFVTTFN